MRETLLAQMAEAGFGAFSPILRIGARADQPELQNFTYLQYG